MLVDFFRAGPWLTIIAGRVQAVDCVSAGGGIFERLGPHVRVVASAGLNGAPTKVERRLENCSDLGFILSKEPSHPAFRTLAFGGFTASGTLERSECGSVGKGETCWPVDLVVESSNVWSF